MYSCETVDTLEIRVDCVCEHFLDLSAVQGIFVGICENAGVGGLCFQKSDGIGNGCQRGEMLKIFSG